MPDQHVPPNHHIVRHAKSRLYDRATGVAEGAAFLLRPPTPERAAEEGLSTNWREFFPGTVEEQIEQIRRLRRLQWKPSEHLLELNVQQVLDTLSELGLEPSVVVAPVREENGYPADDSHSEILGLPLAEDPDAARKAGDRLALVVTAAYPAMPKA